MTNDKKPRVLLIYTGGTIGMVRDGESGALRPFDFENILNNLPEARSIHCMLDTYAFPRLLDSSNITPANWVEIAGVVKDHYEAYDGFVVLHGTDTMAYTASALSFMFSGLSKPVIFTGSQLPIGHLRTDAKENLITSIELASLTGEDGSPVIKEVCLYFQHELYRGNRCTKINAEQFNAFASPNYRSGSFWSTPDGGKGSASAEVLCFFFSRYEIVTGYFIVACFSGNRSADGALFTRL